MKITLAAVLEPKIDELPSEDEQGDGSLAYLGYYCRGRMRDLMLFGPRRRRGVPNVGMHVYTYVPVPGYHFTAQELRRIADNMDKHENEDLQSMLVEEAEEAERRR